MKTRLLIVMSLFAVQFSFANFYFHENCSKVNEFAFSNPITPTLPNLSACSINNLGIGEFNLITQNGAIASAQAGNSNDYAVVYYESFTEASNFGTPISDTVHYQNTVPYSQTVYYRVINLNTNEFAVGSFGLVVIASPVANPPSSLFLCDYNGTGSGIFDFTPLIPQVLGAANASDHTVRFYTSLAAAENGISPITPINLFAGTNGQTIYVRLTSSVTNCYDITSFQLLVYPLPQTMQPNYPEYALCDYSGAQGYETFDLTSQVSTILMGQTGMQVTFYPSLINAQSNTNPITNPSVYTNTTIYVQTLGIKVTDLATGCYSISTMDIKVNPLPLLIPPTSPYTVCDGDGDGIASFDLDGIAADLLQGATYNLTFYETITDAQAGNQAASITGNYLNITPLQQTIYVRAEDPITYCWSIIAIELQVNPSPIAPDLSSIAVCDNDTNPQDAMATIDLTQQTASIFALQTLPASNYQVSFYTNQLDAFYGSSMILPATNYFGSNGETIWYRVENSSSHCYTIGSFQLEVNTPLAVGTQTPLSLCDGDSNPNDQITTFDLTVKNAEITQSIPNYTVTYFPSLANAQTGTNAIVNPTSYVNSQPAVQTLGVRVTSPQGCVSITFLDIRVLPIPTPRTNPPALVSQCDYNNSGDMLELFDLTVNEAYIRNGDPNLTFHYFTTLADAQNNLNEILTPTAALVGRNVWIRVENTRVDYLGNHCYVLVEQPLRVNPLPNVNLVSDNTLNTVYVDASNSVVRPLILDTKLSGNYSFQWELDGDVVGTNSVYVVNTPSLNGSNRVYMVTVQDLSTGCIATGAITVLQSNAGVAPPIGAVSQTFNPGQTLANLNVSGSNILWYATATNRTTVSTPLPLNTVLIDGTTYYASQTINGIESQARLPVTVHLALGVPTIEILPLQFAPNPVKNILNLQSTQVLKSIMVYTMLGQKVFEQNYNTKEITIDLSRLSTANYILKVAGDDGQKTIRIIKE